MSNDMLKRLPRQHLFPLGNHSHVCHAQIKKKQNFDICFISLQILASSCPAHIFWSPKFGNVVTRLRLIGYTSQPSSQSEPCASVGGVETPPLRWPLNSHPGYLLRSSGSYKFSTSARSSPGARFCR